MQTGGTLEVAISGSSQSALLNNDKTFTINGTGSSSQGALLFTMTTMAATTFNNPIALGTDATINVTGGP